MSDTKLEESNGLAFTQIQSIQLSQADQECVAHALISPAQPVPALERAFERHSKMFRASLQLDMPSPTGDELKAARIKAGLSQMDAAALMG